MKNRKIVSKNTSSLLLSRKNIDCLCNAVLEAGKITENIASYSNTVISSPPAPSDSHPNHPTLPAHLRLFVPFRSRCSLFPSTHSGPGSFPHHPGPAVVRVPSTHNSHLLGTCYSQSSGTRSWAWRDSLASPCLLPRLASHRIALPHSTLACLPRLVHCRTSQLAYTRCVACCAVDIITSASRSLYFPFPHCINPFFLLIR